MARTATNAEASIMKDGEGLQEGWEERKAEARAARERGRKRRPAQADQHLGKIVSDLDIRAGR